jgi:lipopolysaccharide biosynthesis glycosyltransferase
LAIADARRWGKVACSTRPISLPFRFRAEGRVSAATYYRFFLPRLSEATGRVLYLDTDTYPDSSKIWDLFELDMGRFAVAASRSLEFAFGDTPAIRKELSASGCPGGKYMNAGVMLFDVAKTKQLRLEEKFLAATRRPGFHDQKAINFVLRGNWCELSPAFNATPTCYVSDIVERFPPVITHFYGETKPWHGAMFYLKHPAGRELNEFIAGSPWPRFVEGQMMRLGWVPGMKIAHTIHQPPPEFLAKVYAYFAATQFADVAIART